LAIQEFGGNEMALPLEAPKGVLKPKEDPRVKAPKGRKDIGALS